MAEVELWTDLVKASFGALGLAMMATGPLVPTPAEFPALRTYAFVAGGLCVLWAATGRNRPLLTVLGFIALIAGLAASIVGAGRPLASNAALALDSGAAILLGAALRRPWAALPFLAVPVLVVAGGPPGWTLEHQDFAAAWERAMGCGCHWPGVPAALALLGAAIGDATARPWPRVRPSAMPVLAGSAGMLMAALVVASVMPGDWGTARLALTRVALVAGILAWVALAYHAGRRAFVVQAGAVGLLMLVGALYVDTTIRYPASFDLTLLANVLASLVPAVLAAVGVLVRQWIGSEGPDRTPTQVDVVGFLDDDAKATYAESEPLVPGAELGPHGRPDEAPTTGGTDRGSPGKGL